MATIIKNKKDFQVIQIGYFEMVGITKNLDPVCDNCLDAKTGKLKEPHSVSPVSTTIKPIFE